MVSDVDKDNDGEVSFEEFQAKVQSVLKETQSKTPGSPGQNHSHWHSLSTLISQFSELEKQKGGEAEKSISKRVSSLGHSKKHKKREKQKKAKSNQHDAMVAHFNLRRLSVDASSDDPNDDIEAALRAMSDASEKSWRAWVKRPMNPSSNFRRFWELMVLILVLFQAIYIPFTVSFRVNHPRYSSWWNFDLIGDVIFMVDLVMTFNVGIINNQNKLIMNRRFIAKQYLKSWFVLDLAASVPFDLIIEAFQDDDNSETADESGGSANTASATSLLKGFKVSTTRSFVTCLTRFMAMSGEVA